MIMCNMTSSEYPCWKSTMVIPWCTMVYYGITMLCGYITTVLQFTPW